MVSKKVILDLVEHYKRELGLEHWVVRVHFDRKSDDPEDAVATSISLTQYMSGDVFFDVKRIEEAREDLELVVRHELMHMITRMLFDVASSLAGRDPDKQAIVEFANEHVTTLLERMPVWRHVRKTARQAGVLYPMSER